MARPFVDREVFIEAFEKSLEKTRKTKSYSVLAYYGIGGIGKTSLRKHLLKPFQKEKNSSQSTNVILASIDFSTESYRQVDKFLGVLKYELHKKYKIKFDSFDFAYATYWQKVHPQIPLLKDGYSEDSIVPAVFDILGGFYSISYSSIKKVIKETHNRFTEWWLKREDEIAELPNMEASDIEKKLPLFFAYDLTDYLQKNPSKIAVFLLDSYEALLEGDREQGNYTLQGQWIKDTIINITGSSLWVIFGREKLNWEETDNQWTNYLEQYKLEKLLENDASKFLELCGIKEKDIQNVIIDSSEGVPYYLELAVDTYTRIKDMNQIPKRSDFSGTRSEIVDRFIKYLDIHERETLKVLSVPRFLNKEIFKALIGKFNTGYPLTAFSELSHFSFVQESEGRTQLHPLMKKSLQEQDLELTKEIHSFMCDYYIKQFSSLEIMNINKESEFFISEAFYHAKQAFEAKQLAEWVFNTFDSFRETALWRLINPIYEDLLVIIENELGSEHLIVAKTRNNLAEIYRNMGEYEKALPLYISTLERIYKMPEELNPNIAIIENNLADLYEMMGEYEKALPLYRHAIEVLENIRKSDHLDVERMRNSLAIDIAEIQDNLAKLYEKMGDYKSAFQFYTQSLQAYEQQGVEDSKFAGILCHLAGFYEEIGEYTEALRLFQRALIIDEKLFGLYHPHVSRTLDGLAGIYEKMGEYQKALVLYKRALDIDEKIYGKNHLVVSTVLNNLALLYGSLGGYKEALPLYHRALEIRKKILGSEHLEFISVECNLATLYLHMGEYEKALPLYLKVLQVRKEVLQPDHPDIATTLNNLATLYNYMGEYEKALSSHDQANEIIQKILGTGHPYYGMSLINKAAVYENLRDYEKAHLLYQQGINILETKLGEKHPETLSAKHNYSNFLKNIKG